MTPFYFALCTKLVYSAPTEQTLLTSGSEQIPETTFPMMINEFNGESTANVSHVTGGEATNAPSLEELGFMEHRAPSSEESKLQMSPGQIIELNDSNFKEFVRSNPLSMIRFSAPWATSDDMTREIMKLVASRSDYLVGDVNLQISPEIQDHFEVTRYPIIYILANGKLAGESPTWDWDDIITWFKEATAEMDDDQDLEAWYDENSTTMKPMIEDITSTTMEDMIEVATGVTSDEAEVTTASDDDELNIDWGSVGGAIGGAAVFLGGACVAWIWMSSRQKARTE